MLSALIISSILCSFVQSEYTKFKWNSCNTQLPGLTINQLDVKPMPIVCPGNISVTADIDVPRGFMGIVKAKFTISRSVAGLILPLRCFMISQENGVVQFGSCTYNDFCKEYIQGLLAYSKNNCSPVLKAAGFDCECPFNRGSGKIVFNEVVHEITTFFPEGLESLASGDFDYTIELNDGQNVSQYLGCFKFGFSLKKVIKFSK